MSDLTKGILAACVIVIVVLAYAGFVLYVSWPISFGNIDKAGVFGDSFGLLTSLFSGLAFAGIIFTVFLQSKELKLQRDELRLTRQEFEKQNTTLKKQNFESTFFQMVRLHHEIVGSIKLVSIHNQPEGRDCFQAFYHELHDHHRKLQSTPKGAQKESKDELIEAAFDLLWGKYQGILGHYFRNLYTLFKFVKASDVEDRRLYSNIVRAQLSDYELIILFYNCLSKFGKEKFKPMAEEFALFDNLPKEKLFIEEHKSLYADKAFGSKVA
jgi:hypothetical protein